jgi:hypothetical protein
MTTSERRGRSRSTPFPAARRDGDLPEGLAAEDYAAWANFDADHYVKSDLIIPWLQSQFS